MKIDGRVNKVEIFQNILLNIKLYGRRAFISGIMKAQTTNQKLLLGRRALTFWGTCDVPDLSHNCHLTEHP